MEEKKINDGERAEVKQKERERDREETGAQADGWMGTPPLACFLSVCSVH